MADFVAELTALQKAWIRKQKAQQKWDAKPSLSCRPVMYLSKSTEKRGPDKERCDRNSTE